MDKLLWKLNVQECPEDWQGQIVLLGSSTFKRAHLVLVAETID